MKLIIVLQFLLFSLFSITQIEQDSFSKKIIYTEKLEINTPISTETQIKSIADFSLKYICVNTHISLFHQNQVHILSNYKSNFKLIFTHPQLARSPPLLLA